MAWIAPVIGAGSAIAGMFQGGGEKMDPKAIRRFFDTADWSGHLGPEDYAAANLAQARLAGAAAAAGQGQRMNIARRYEARGLAGSPAEETGFQRTAEDEAMGRERAANTASEMLYNTRLGREREAYSRNMAELNAMVGAAGRQQYSSDLKQSSFFNSLLDYGPQIISGLGHLGASGDTPADYGKPGGFPLTGYSDSSGGGAGAGAGDSGGGYGEGGYQ